MADISCLKSAYLSFNVKAASQTKVIIKFFYSHFLNSLFSFVRHLQRSIDCCDKESSFTSLLPPVARAHNFSPDLYVSLSHCSKLPSWARAVVPKIFYVTEKAWNYYPYTITGKYTVQMPFGACPAVLQRALLQHSASEVLPSYKKRTTALSHSVVFKVTFSATF